jgi:peroxiredoxin
VVVSEPMEVGRSAPGFSLPAANREGQVSLADYRGTPVLLALFRGLYCPFCRHQIARMAITAGKLRGAGVETLGVVATAAERARLYYRYRPVPIPLAADPDLSTHRAYGLPGLALTPELNQAIDAASLQFARELGVPARPGTAHEDVSGFDGYTVSKEDHADFDRHQAQMIGQFLIDGDGVVRWAHVEQSPGDFPSEAELLATVRAAA